MLLKAASNRNNYSSYYAFSGSVVGFPDPGICKEQNTIECTIIELCNEMVHET